MAVSGLGEKLHATIQGIGEHMAAATADSAKAMAETVTTAVTRQVDVEKERPIQVVNTLPKYYGTLYQQQIEVIEKTLVPMLTAINENTAENVDVRKNLQKLVAFLRRRVDRQEKARKFGDNVETDQD